jgi:alkylhydroperoxidase family enzyme
MAHLAGTPDEVAARVPGVAETYAEIRDNVLLSGVVEQSLKDLCFRFLADDPEATDVSRYEGRERAALDWTLAIVWDSDRADDELWERLHSHFSEEELVDLGCAVGFELGRTHWLRTLGVKPGLPHAPTA